MNVLCMSAAYASDLSSEGFPARIPVNYETGEIDFEAFLSWETHDPIQLIERPEIQQALRQLKCLFIDAGDHDEYLLHLGARRFVKKLRQFNIEHMHEEFPGGHRGTSFRYDKSIPLLVNALVSE